MTPYATPAQLAEFLSADDAATVAEPERVLARASELVDDTVRRPFTLDDDGLPVDATLAEALRDAVCAQVEYWLEVDEAHDIGGMAGRRVTIGNLSVDRLPCEVAPRAVRILRQAGLMTGRGFDRADVTFFATQTGT